MSVRTLTGAALAVTAGLASVALGSPARAAEAQPDVRTAVAFSQETGKVGDTVTVTVTVSNTGTATAEDVSVRREWDDALTWTSPALAGGPAFDLAAGESKVLTRTGTIPEKALTDGYIQVLYFLAAANTDKNINDNIAYRSIRVPGRAGDYTVHVVDAGTNAGVPGAVVEFTELSNSPGNVSARITSDAAGNARLTGTQVGRYDLKVTAPAGWRTGEVSHAQVNVKVEPDDFTFKLERTGEPTAAPSAPTPSPSAGGDQPGATAGPSASAPAPGTGSGGGDDGGLPVTGSATTVVAVTGVGLLMAGAAAFLLARQRRTRFTPAD
ncbi:carboxypeptidase-like regulatory domain-containing protein [Nucisporomicrobium flavum]|uniref:carboxypeptidase-like regulatory domain-containing protein n=1 Tax=Nucisporomicrobium flavum TaxID=2785915 RepID=UPI0018F63684|nr:carboxypeptidase-like regulatory domain-containing protein [Nucisporomicrobium flavum]